MTPARRNAFVTHRGSPVEQTVQQDGLSREDAVERVAELVKDIRMAMLVTIDHEGRPHSRPMATQEAPFDGTLWFLTSADSLKTDEIARNPMVNVAYASGAKESYLSLTGRAEVLNDREKIREFWSVWLRPWFEGPEDPSIRILRVRVDEADYWDTPGGKVASLLSIAKSVITGTGTDASSDTGKVRF